MLRMTFFSSSLHLCYLILLKVKFNIPIFIFLVVYNLSFIVPFNFIMNFSIQYTTLFILLSRGISLQKNFYSICWRNFCGLGFCRINYCDFCVTDIKIRNITLKIHKLAKKKRTIEIRKRAATVQMNFACRINFCDWPILKNFEEVIFPNKC